jgi:hypothetical protein
MDEVLQQVALANQLKDVWLVINTAALKAMQSIDIAVDVTTAKIKDLIDTVFLVPAASGMIDSLPSLNLYNKNEAYTIQLTNSGTTPYYSVLAHDPGDGNIPKVVNGSTSGTATFIASDMRANVKEVTIHLAALSGTATYVFPAAFTFIPDVLNTNGLASSVVTSISATSVTVTGSTTTGNIYIKGQ